MSETRRELLHRIGASVSLAVGAEFLPAQEAQHVHQAVAQDKAAGPYKPKAPTAHEYATLRRRADLIIPPDEHAKGADWVGSTSR